MLDIKNLTIKIQDRFLVKNLSFHLNKGDKLAIIGEEGNGKSTLLKAILGICEYASVEGSIQSYNYRIGYLEQSLNESVLNQTVFSYLFSDEVDYYENINSFYKYLKLFFKNDQILNQSMNTLSGGEKVKVNFLKLFLLEYDIFFLDEPTNDLDIETLEWLEHFLNVTEKPIVYVSHDETLLEQTATMVLHLEQVKKKMECRSTFLKADYATYVTQWMNFIDHQNQMASKEFHDYQKKQAKLNQIMQKVEHRQNTISRSDPHGAQLLKKKMHSLKSQEKKLENLNLTEKLDVEESILFAFDVPALPKDKCILTMDLDELNTGNKVLVHNIHLEVFGNTHLCFIGKNGVGKSTLLKKIYEILRTRQDIHVGYMPQNYNDILGKSSVLDFICTDKSKECVTKSRMLLGNMKFTKEEMEGNISALSNGEKAKLILAHLVLEKYNVLILDEPTRNVSPLSNPVIRLVLKEFKGTIISVSHDRKFLKEVIDQVYLVTEDGLKLL